MDTLPNLDIAVPSTRLKSVAPTHWDKCILHFVKSEDWGALGFMFLNDEMLPDATRESAASAVPLVPFIGSKMDNEQLLTSLIAHGASVDSSGEESDVTPLRAAHKAGNQRLATFLLEKGADPVTISSSSLPVHVASSWAVNSKMILSSPVG